MAVTGRMIFPLNTQLKESDFETAMDGTNVYSTKAGSTAKTYAYKNVSVNPLLVTLGADNETDYVSADVGNPPIASTIYTEIRKGPHTGLPTVTSKLLSCENVQNTPSYKVKIFDSNEDITATNRKVTYSSTPDSNTSLDIETYDYFILLNPELIPAYGRDSGVSESGSNKTTIRPHFAKITRITTFDSFGDGVEFLPKYSGEIPIGTNIEIFRGPAKTETDIVAVSYGLRGDTDANTDKYDKICRVNRPTFYFYNDRLEEEDQLDYNEKYTLTSYRDWSNSTNITITTVVGSLSQFEEGSTSKYYKVSLTDYNKLHEGMSLFKSDGTYLGNIESKYVNDPLGTINYRLYLDYLRPSSDVSSGDTVTIGKTVQNVVFKTERKYDDTIQNLGRDRLDAVLVDKYLTSDEADGNFNPIFWHKAFVDMKRSATNSTTATSASDGGRNGPSRYITFESAALKNDKIPITMETLVNSPRNKISKVAEIKALDNSGIQHLKYKKSDKMVVRNGLYTNTMKIRKLEHTVTTNSTKLEFNNNSKVNDDASYDDDYTAILTTGSIIEVGDYYYRVNVVDAKADETKQGFTVSHNRLKTATTWTASATPPTVTNADIYIVPYSNGKFNLGFAADTEIKPAQSNRILLEGHTIDKEDTKLYNSKITMNGFVGHDIKVDYGDKDLKYVAIQDADKQYYQKRLDTADPPNIINIPRMYYYNGGFTLHEEVFEGEVEKIQHHTGLGEVGYTIYGRDKLANLITNTVDSNNNFSNDIVYSTLVPSLDISSSFTISYATTTADNTIYLSGDQTSNISTFTIFFDDDYQMIGEYHSAVYTNLLPDGSSSGTYRTLVTLKSYTNKDLSVTDTIYHYSPVDSSKRHIAGAKAILVNNNETTKPTSFGGATGKGLIFSSGMNYTYASNAFSYSKLNLTSNDGDYLTNKTLGYHLNSIKGLEKENGGGASTFTPTPSENFLLKLAKEQDDYVNTIKKDISSSLYLDVVSIEDVSSSENIVSLAAKFPINLGLRIANSNDSRFNSSGATSTSTSSIYLLNSNLPIGGYLHRLKHLQSRDYASVEFYRYLDRQKFDAGTLNPHSITNIYKDANRDNKFHSYLNGHRLDGRGEILAYYSANPIKDDTDWWKDSSGNTNLAFDVDESSVDTATSKLLNQDYRAATYQLFAYGDLFPNSFIKHNSIGYSSNSNSLTNFGLMFESNSTKGTSITHDWRGKTNTVQIRDSNFSNSTIVSSTLDDPTQIKRWGIIRLVEATFDWHFNPVDAESVYSEEKLPRVNLKHYVKRDINNSNAISLYDLYASEGNKMDDLSDINSFISGSTTVYSHPAINFTQVNIVRPNFYSSYYRYALLHQVGGTSNKYDAPNIILPLKSQTSNATISSTNYLIDSAFHSEGITGSSLTNQKQHRSKVVHGLCKPNELDYTTNPVPYFNVDHPAKDIYDNCIAIFKNITRISESEVSDNNSFDNTNVFAKITSSPLVLDDFIDLSSSSSLTGRLGNDQHSQNIQILKSSEYSGLSLDIALLGAKTKEPIAKDQIDLTTTTRATHQGLTNSGNGIDNGKLYSGQMFIKPQFNISADVSANSTKSFTMNSSSTHHWLNYVPKLEGYYIVSDKLESDGYLPTSDSGVSDYSPSGVPKYIGKIISHTITTTSVTIDGTSQTINVHNLKFDKTIDVSEVGNYFRLMRISDTTFEDTPNKIEINKMHDSGLKYDIIPSNFLTGLNSAKDQFSEGIYSMYMLLNIDETANANYNYLERRDFTTANNLFSNGDEIDCFITDGQTSQRKSLTVTKSSTEITFEYDGVLNGNGCVSFGKVFDITIPTKLPFNPKYCYLGTTFSIGELVENEIENIANNSNLEVNIERSFREYTGLIVNSISSNVITLFNTPTNLSVNDVIYNQHGYLIGTISAKNDGNKTITIGTGVSGDGNSDLIFSPAQYDEITTRNKRTFVSTSKFDNTDALSAINFLANKKGLDYKLSGKILTLRNLDDIYASRKYYIDFRKNNRLISVDNSDSLFDEANKIIVQGDNVKAEMELLSNSTTKTIRHIDTSIKTLDEAKIKANELLALHSSPSKKITLTLQKEGLELLEAGDVVTLDFPSQGIPRDDYLVFEIENVLSGTTKITVGTFDKNIAERLSELNTQGQNINFTLLSGNQESSNVGKLVTDNLDIDQNNIEYAITTVTTTGGIISGFGNTLGFGSTLGFGTATTSTLKEYESGKSEGI